MDDGRLYIDGEVANYSFYSEAKLTALGVSDGVQCGPLHVLLQGFFHFFPFFQIIIVV